MFVGNLNFSTTQDELVELLSGAGQIVDIHLPTDRMSGRPRGFAFVEYSSEAEAAASIEKYNGHELGGRALRINEAEERPQRTGPRSFRNDSNGGGGGGYGGPGGKGKGNKSKGSRRGLRGRKRSL